MSTDDATAPRTAFDRWIGDTGTPPCPIARHMGFRMIEVDRAAGRVLATATATATSARTAAPPLTSAG